MKRMLPAATTCVENPRTPRVLAPWVLVSALLYLLTAPSAEAGQFVDLGVQISSSTVIGTTFGKDGAGHDVVYTVMRGHPAKMLMIDLNSGELLKTLALPGADGAWNACTASDGTIYAGSDSNGHLYRYIPGEDEVHDIGRPQADQTWVWDVTPGKDAEVFLGTYPGAFVYRYHPRDGFSDVGRGAVAPGESYTRAVAWDPETGKIYAGVGSHAHLIEIDPRTGEKHDLLPKEHRDQEFVYGVNVFNGRLFALITRANKSLVFSLRSKELIAVLPKVAGQQVMTQDDQNHVYYTYGGELLSWDYRTADQPPRVLAKCADALAMDWRPGSLIGFTKGGIFRFDIQSGKMTNTPVKLPAEPTDIQSIEAGPDGKIWSDGYLSGGTAAFDPETGRSEQFGGLSQAEDMTVVGSTIYFGLYPGAKLALYDTSKPWNKKAGNPRQFGDLGTENQSRPMAMCGVEELNQVFIGTIPEYGQLGGVLAVYNIAADWVVVHHDVVPKQSIVSLAYARGVIVGGTSIYGGLGQQPESKEAKLFIWDPANSNKIFETVPLADARAITGLFVGPDGNVWGLAEGTLFIFNPATRKIASRHELFPREKNSKHTWRDAFFAIHPSGDIYGTAHSQFFRLDPKSMKLTVLRDKGVLLLAMDRAGRLYFREGTHLWRYEP